MILKNSSKNIFNRGANFLLLALLIASCSQKNSKPLSKLAELQLRGKNLYMANCTACHNPDPRLVGSIGPNLDGSSLELLTARVVHQAYPPGYVPKRKSGLMPALPFLEKDLPAIHAYLNSFIKP